MWNNFTAIASNFLPYFLLVHAIRQGQCRLGFVHSATLRVLDFPW